MNLSNFNVDTTDPVVTTLLSWLYNGVSDSINNIVTSSLLSFPVYMSVMFYTAAVLFVALYGISVMYGWIETSAKRITRDLVSFSIIIILFANYENVFSIGQKLFIEFPGAIATAVIPQKDIQKTINDPKTSNPDDPSRIADSSDATSLSNQKSTSATKKGSPLYYLDNLYILCTAYLYDSFNNISVGVSGVSGFGSAFSALILWLAITFFAIVVLFRLIQTVIFANLLLLLGPLMLLFAFFPKTRGITQAWIGQLITYAFILLITLMIVGFMLYVGSDRINALQASIVDSTNVAHSGDLFSTIVLCIIAGFSTKEIPSLAQALGNGIALTGDQSKATQAVVGATKLVGSQIAKIFKNISAPKGGGAKPGQ